MHVRPSGASGKQECLPHNPQKFALHSPRVVAIVPPPLSLARGEPRHVEAGRLRRRVRLLLLALAAGLLGIFALAASLNPYKDGRVWLEETHRQLGMPPCSFKRLTGKPCPSCGMTSSFALLVRGDVWHSLEANAAGTALALLLAAVLAWSLACALAGRQLWIRSVEPAVLRLVVFFFVLMMVRWGLVLWLG